MSREWRRETQEGYVIISENIGRESENGGPWRPSKPMYFITEFHSDGSKMRNSYLAWSPTLEAAKRQYREWGITHPTSRRWIEENQ